MPELASRSIGARKWLSRFKIKSLRHGKGTTAKHRSQVAPDEPAWEPEGPFPFLRLPRELRNEVYKYALVHPDHNEIWIRFSKIKKEWYNATRLCRTCPNARDEYRGPRAQHEINVSLVLASRIVHDEALEILYAKNDIWIDASPSKTLEFLSRLPPIALNYIHSLKLWLDVYLDCNPLPYNFDQMHESELSERRQRVQNELLEPWQSVYDFIGSNLPGLSTLSVRLGRERSEDLAKVGSVSREWQEFYRIGWIQRVKLISQIRTLLVEARCCTCERLCNSEPDSFNDLRRDLRKGSRFKEVSLKWNSYFFATGGFDPREYPKASLHIKLQRLPDNGQHEAGANKPALSPLPPFEPKYSWEDTKIFLRWGCMMGGYPPETPNPDR